MTVTRAKNSSFLQLLLKHKLLWLVPTIGFFVFSLIYSTIGPKKYRATQKLVVRDQLIGGSHLKPGRFESTESLKSAQESISEIAHNPSVIKRALQAAQISGSSNDAPGPALVEQIQGSISVTSPGGAEFGKTEMLDVSIIASNREDGAKLITALTAEIENQLRMLRQALAKSMLLESTQTVEFAKEKLAKATEELKKMETEIGADLSELRNLNNPNSIHSSLQSSLAILQTELRAATNEQESLRKQQLLLRQAAMAPNGILSTPEEVFVFLPALEALKQGLVQAQITLSKALGKYTDNHPNVESARTAIKVIETKLQREIVVALKSKEKELEIATAKTNRLTTLGTKLSNRIARLSEKRVEYDEVFSLFQKRKESLTAAEADLLQIESQFAAAQKVNYITRVDEPYVDWKPQGLPKRVVVGSGTLFGLLLGVGLVMFLGSPTNLAPPPPYRPHPESGDRSPQIHPSSTSAQSPSDDPSPATVRSETQHSTEQNSVTKAVETKTQKENQPLPPVKQDSTAKTKPHPDSVRELKPFETKHPSQSTAVASDDAPVKSNSPKTGGKDAKQSRKPTQETKPAPQTAEQDGDKQRPTSTESKTKPDLQSKPNLPSTSKLQSPSPKPVEKKPVQLEPIKKPTVPDHSPNQKLQADKPAAPKQVSPPESAPKPVEEKPIVEKPAVEKPQTGAPSNPLAQSSPEQPQPLERSAPAIAPIGPKEEPDFAAIFQALTNPTPDVIDEQNILGSAPSQTKLESPGDPSVAKEQSEQQANADKTKVSQKLNPFAPKPLEPPKAKSNETFDQLVSKLNEQPPEKPKAIKPTRQPELKAVSEETTNQPQQPAPESEPKQKKIQPIRLQPRKVTEPDGSTPQKVTSDSTAPEPSEPEKDQEEIQNTMVLNPDSFKKTKPKRTNLELLRSGELDQPAPPENKDSASKNKDPRKNRGNIFIFPSKPKPPQSDQ